MINIYTRLKKLDSFVVHTIKMKKLFFCIAISCLVSCKKTYTCECYTTFTYQQRGAITGQNYTQIIPGNKEAYTQKMTEKQAKAACSHEAKAVETDFANNVSNNGTFPLANGSPTTSCGLK